MAKNWYSIEAKADENAAEINIFDAIGNTWDGEGVTAKKFIADLKPLNGKALTVFINSPGGSVMDGLAIYNALKAHQGGVTVKVLGWAASAASFIAMAGDKIVMPENTFMMVHNPLSWAYGNASDFREVADTLDKIGGSIVNIYVARTGKSEDDVKALLDAETWMTAKEAVDKGFADEVVAEIAAVNAAFDVSKLPENVRAAFEKGQQQIENKATPTLAEQIKGLVDSANLGDYVDQLVVLDSLDSAKARIGEIGEINALCGMLSIEAKGYIVAGKTPAEVRADIIAARAAKDEITHTSTTPPATNEQSNPKPTQPNALNISDVWAKRQNINRK